MAVFDNPLDNFDVSAFGFSGVGALSGFVSTPVIVSETDPVYRNALVAMSFFSTTDQSEKISFDIEFYQLNDTFIVSYDQDTSPFLFDKPSGYNSGENAIFVVPEDSPILVFDDVKYRVRGTAGSSVSGFSSFEDLGLSDLNVRKPEVVSCPDDDTPVFRWIQATDIAIDAAGLTYNIAIYSATSSLSALYNYSTLEGMSASSVLQYYSILSALNASGLLSAMYADSGINGCSASSYLYWELMTSLSAGSYLARVNVLDSASHLMWSLFEPFEIGELTTMILQPGFNLYRIPVRDEDALTARQFMENKVGYYMDNGSSKPFISEIVRWDEEVDKKQWKSVVASIDNYSMTDDFDFEHTDGYFINLDFDESIAVKFRGESWI